MSPLKKGQKLTDNPKNVNLSLRLTKSEAEDLQYCADKLNKNRTSVINEGVEHIMNKITEEEMGMKIKINIGKEKCRNVTKYTSTDMTGKIIEMGFRDGATNIASISDKDGYLIVTINDKYIESTE